MGMAFYAENRKEKAGWGWLRITFYFLIRGLLLFILQFACENVALLLRAVTMGGISNYWSEPPISTSDYPLYFGGLHTMGVCVMVGTLFLLVDARLHVRQVRMPVFGAVSVGTLILAFLCFACTLVTQLVVHFVKQSPTCCDPFVKWLVVAGQAGGGRGRDAFTPAAGAKYNINVERVFMAYPVLPWMAVWLFGVLLARMFQHIGTDKWRYRALGLFGLFLWGLFALLRGVGVGAGFWFGNFRLPAHTTSADLGNAFFSFSAFPPDLSYLLFWLGVVMVTGWIIHATGLPKRFISRPANVFGRSSLFFYLAHLWLYLALGWAFSRQRNGDPVYYAYPVWFLGLAILYPFCAWYAHFKARRSLGSFVRWL